jgi:hypothetical protein
MKYYKCLIYIVLITSVWSCKKNQELESIRRSATNDIDLYLTPHKFNVLEADWINIKYYSKYDKGDLIRHLRSYGRTLDDLKQNPELEYKEEENIVTLKVARTAHSTSYDYDTSIPVIFYGPNWIQKGEYTDAIHQQHIVPTLAKILKIRNPNGVETHPLTQILKTNTEGILPEIIVTVVVDQGGQQYYKSHPEIPIQILKIKQDAAYFPNALVGHLDAETAVGHAAIGTGAYPRKNGIIGNGYLKYVNGKLSRNEIYTTSDQSVNPGELLVETLGDVLDNEYRGESEVISQCYALRASIGMAGHGASKINGVDYLGDKDLVYWLSAPQSQWVTDSRYYTLPSETIEYNPLVTFNQEYPDGWEGISVKNLKEIHKYWGILMGNPAETKSEAELFRKVIKNHLIEKGRHKDGIPDLAYMTIKSTDAVAHQFGFESLEAKETFREADKQIGLLFDFLQKEYGNNFILIITADHGGTPMPELSNAERYTMKELVTEINTLLPENIREAESLISFMTIAQISLNHEVLKKYSITERQIADKIMSIEVNHKPFFKKVFTKTDLK